MQPNEMRIGNLFCDRGHDDIVCVCTSIDQKGVSYEDGMNNDKQQGYGFIPWHYVTGITLDCWFLKNAGFNFYQYKSVMDDIIEIGIKRDGVSYLWSITDFSKEIFIPSDLHYFHQVQNLFFDLTGKELLQKTENQTDKTKNHQR